MARSKHKAKSVEYYWNTWKRLHKGKRNQPLPNPWNPEVYTKIVLNAPEYMKEYIEAFYLDTVGVEYYPIKQ